jgi:hypothetical protein
VAALPVLVFGAIICNVDLIYCVPLEKVEGQPYANGPWCWIPDYPEPLRRPVPLAGKLGLFVVHDELSPRVHEQRACSRIAFMGLLVGRMQECGYAVNPPAVVTLVPITSSSPSPGS